MSNSVNREHPEISDLLGKLDVAQADTARKSREAVGDVSAARTITRRGEMGKWVGVSEAKQAKGRFYFIRRVGKFTVGLPCLVVWTDDGWEIRYGHLSHTLGGTIEQWEPS